MKTQINSKMIMLLLLLVTLIAEAKVNISLDDPRLSYDGVFYPVVTPSKVELNRHLPSMITNWESGIGGTWINQWVITQTGVRIRFKTASPNIDLQFTKREGGGTIGSTPSQGFTVFANGVEQNTFSTLSFSIQNTGAQSVLFEVVLPNLWAIDFTGMQIDDNYVLESLAPLNKPVYVSIGNSITHGTGQYVSSAKGYPFLLSKMMDWDLHNIAVAGATLGWAISLNLKQQQVDYISVLIGYNDWEYSGATLESKRVEYEKLLDSLRIFQPAAKIICISPLYSSDVSGSAPYSLEEFRGMVEEVVGQKQLAGDTSLCFISGPAISDASMLASGDVVHLSEVGASKLANALYEKINNCSSSLNSNRPVKKNDFEFTVYKNTSKDLVIRSNVEGKFAFTMYDVQGRSVIAEDVFLSIGNNVISHTIIQSLHEGPHIVCLANRDGGATQKLLILK